MRFSDHSEEDVMLTAGSITWVHYDAAAAANPNQLRVRRVNASYDQRDLLYTSGAVVPDYLGLSTEGYGVPNVIVELEDSSLIGVLGCSVGYGGSGGSLTHIALTSLQVPAHVVDAVVAHRYSDVDITNPAQGVLTQQWPHVHLPWPEKMTSASGERWVYRTSTMPDPAGFGTRETNVDGGFYPTPSPDSAGHHRVLDYLNGSPTWVGAGPQRRVGVLFTSANQAQTAGFHYEPEFPLHTDDWPATFCLVIEQGIVQLWVEVDGLRDGRWSWVTPEIRNIFRIAGLREPASPCSSDTSTRVLASLRGLVAGRPTMIGSTVESSRAPVLQWMPDPE